MNKILLISSIIIGFIMLLKTHSHNTYIDKTTNAAILFAILNHGLTNNIIKYLDRIICLISFITYIIHITNYNAYITLFMVPISYFLSKYLNNHYFHILTHISICITLYIL